jgi:hypothetical protein
LITGWLLKKMNDELKKKRFILRLSAVTLFRYYGTEFEFGTEFDAVLRNRVWEGAVLVGPTKSKFTSLFISYYIFKSFKS